MLVNVPQNINLINIINISLLLGQEKAKSTNIINISLVWSTFWWFNPESVKDRIKIISIPFVFYGPNWAPFLATKNHKF